MNYQDIIATLRNDPNFDEVKVKEALNFAIKHHRDNNHQFIEIAKTITSVYPDTNSTIAALLFFSFAKSNLKATKIQRFNTEISKLFNALTKLFQIHNTYSHDTTQETLKLLLSLEPDIGIRILLIRFAYLLNQIIFDSKVSDIEYYLTSDEISNIYVPLFQEVTIENIKTALQDGCLTILQPQLHELIVTCLTEQYPNQQQSVISTINTLHDILSVVDIAYTISGRVKSCYSIAKKIVQKSSKVTELFDIIGIRVIVEGEDQCYKILDTIYNNYKHIPERYKDFIKFPKKSGYQSLHMVIVKDSQKIEVQIRTKRMHHIALFGSASHLQYKMPSIRTNATLHSAYDLLNKYILDILNPFTINIRLKTVRIANESVDLRSEVIGLITQDIEISQLHYRFSYQEHAAYYVAEVITVNTIEVNQLSRQLVNIDDRIDITDIDVARTSHLQDQYLVNIRTSYQDHDNPISGVNKQVDHNQQYAEALLNKPPYIKTDLPLDNMDNDYRDNHSIQNNKKSSTLEVVKNDATIIPESPIELSEKLVHSDPSQETVITHYQDIDWYPELISLKSKTSCTNVQNDSSVPMSIGALLQIASARELAGDTERKITTYIDVAEDLCTDSKTKLPAAVDLPKISIKSDIVNSGEFGARIDGANPICNRRVTSNDVTNFLSIDYNALNYINTAVLVDEKLEEHRINFGDQNIHDLNSNNLGSFPKAKNITYQFQEGAEDTTSLQIADTLNDNDHRSAKDSSNDISKSKQKISSWRQDIKLNEEHVDHMKNPTAELNMQVNNNDKDSWRIPIKTAYSIQQNDPITIDLRDEKIKDSDIETLVSILKESNITHLTLNTNEKSYEIFKAFISLLKDTKITSLSFEHNYITDIEILASILKDTNITHLSLEHNYITDIEILASILKDTNITHLSLEHNYITDIEILASVLRDTNIIHLNLASNQIAESCTIALVSILKDTQIIYLNLSGNNIGDTTIQGVGILPQYTKITYLDLGYNRIDDTEIKTLASILQNTQITKLNLAHNQIGNSGAIELASVLKDTKITKLNLAYNQIGNSGAIKLASVLKDTKIAKLILDGNLIDNTGINALISIQKNTKIIINFEEQQKEIDNNMIPCDKGNITKLGYIEEFPYPDSNDYMSSESGYGGSVCSTYEELETQDKESCSIPIKTFVSILQKDPNMTYLDLQNQEIEDSDIETLVSLLKDTSITHLDLKHNNIFVQQKVLSVGGCESTLKSTRIRIKYLELENNTRYTCEIKNLASIFKYIEVEHLNLACNRIGNHNESMKQLANILKDTEIKHLELQNNCIDDLDIEALVAILPKTNITHLSLDDNKITTKGAKILINTLNNTRLIKLDLKHNHIEDKDIATDQKPGGCQIDFDYQETIYPTDFYPGNFPKLQNITYPLQNRTEDNSFLVSQAADNIDCSPNYDLLDEKSKLLGEISIGTEN